MMPRSRTWGWLLLAQAACGIAAEWHYRQLPRLALTHLEMSADRIAVIIPARDEEGSIRAVVSSLRQSADTLLEIWVVDDRSSDATAARAHDAGARVVCGRDLPDGWVGKNHACWQGVQAAMQSGSEPDWLLFVDADTTYEVNAVRHLVASAQIAGVDAYSIFLQQHCGSFWERVVLPYAYATYFVGVSGRQANTASHRTALANGQCLLVRQAAYAATGGHSAPEVRGSVVDDLALATLLKKSGYRLRVARGEQIGAVRMYRNFASLRAGFAKNALGFLQINPRAGLLTVLATLLYGATVPAMWAAWHNPQQQGRFSKLALMSAVPALSLWPWYRRFKVPTRYIFTYPLAHAAFQTISLQALANKVLRRGVTWKGRTYR